MKKHVLFFVAMFTITAVSFCSEQGPARVDVTSFTKPIQRDGFLLEWRPQTATLIDAARDMRCDAVNTAHGLSGYVRYQSPDTCTEWILRVYPHSGVWRNYMEMRISSGGIPGPMHAVDTVIKDSVLHVAVEWVIPWDSLLLDSAGGYETAFLLYGECGDTARPFVLYGQYDESSVYPGVWTARLRLQALMILMLLVFYIVLYKKSRKYKRKK